MVDFSLWRFGALAASLIPGALIFLMLLRIGDRRLSASLLTVAVASGAMISHLPLAFSLLEPAARATFEGASFFYVRAFVFAGLSEEGGKLLACVFIVMPHFRRRGRADLVLACAGVGLGFALIENVSYVLRAPDQWKSIALIRAISSVPMHAFLGLVMGLGLARAETASRRAAVVLATWLLCATLHGFYDLPMFLGEILPLSTPLVNSLAGALSITPPTLLAAAYFLAATATIGSALRAVSICRRDLAEASRSDRPRLVRLSPPILDRLVFCAPTGLLLGALLALGGAALVAVGFVAWAAGAEPIQPLFGAALGAFVATLGFGFGGDPFAALLHDRARHTRGLAAFAVRRRLAAAAVAAAVLAAGVVGAHRGVAAFRHSVAMSLVESGLSRSAVGSLDRAIADYDAAFGYVPDLLAAYLARAEAYRIMQDYDRALADVDRAVELHPDAPGAHAIRAIVLAARHDYARALPALDRALTLDPDNVTLLAARGNAFLDSANLEAASADAERALHARPDLALAHDLLARILMEKDDTDGAIARYGEAIRIDPKHGGALFSRGRLYFEKQDYLAATEDFWRAALIGGNRSYAALWLFLARTHSGKDGRRELANWSRATARDAWPFPLIELYLGARPFASVAAAATTNDQRCELAFYGGELAILAKKMEDAARLLSVARALCPNDFIEARASRKELARVEAALAAERRETHALGLEIPAPARPAPPPIADAPQSRRKADWRALPPGGPRGASGALEIRAIELPDGLIGALSLHAAAEPGPRAELAAVFTCRPTGKPANVDFRGFRLTVAGPHPAAIVVAQRGYGLFHAKLSQAEALGFVEALRDGLTLKFAAQGEALGRYGDSRPEAEVEIDDDARAAARDFAQSLASAAPPPLAKAPLAARPR